MSTPQDALSKAEQALYEGQAHEAFSHLRGILEYPGPADEGLWQLTQPLFAEVTLAIAGGGLAKKVKAATSRGVLGRRTSEGEARGLYDLGYDLIEHGLHGIAATYLSRANRLAPDVEEVLTEYVAALEGAGHNAAAVEALEGASEHMLEGSVICRYLLAFNRLASGEADGARQAYATLDAEGDETIAVMIDNIDGMLRRYDALSQTQRSGNLDNGDLRGWHFVMNGGLLTHLSPFGRDQGMKGRYAFVQDSSGMCHEALLRLQHVLATAGHSVERITSLPDRSSEILATAAAEILGVKHDRWSGEARGLIVGYDLTSDELNAFDFTTLSAHRPGQVLWEHAANWVNMFGLTPDVTTFLHQMNTAPWTAQVRVDQHTQEVAAAGTDDRPVEAIARGILDAAVEPNALADLDDLQTIVDAARALEPDHNMGLLRENGDRRRQFADSPVKSSRFV